MVKICFFFFKQKTAYEMRISDWSSDVCSSDLAAPAAAQVRTIDPNAAIDSDLGTPPAPTTTQDAPTATLSNTQSYPDPDAYPQEIGRASCRERVCQYV